MKVSVAVLTLAMAVGMAGCASTPPSAKGSSTLFLSKTNWVAENINQTALLDNSRITLSFSGDDKIGGTAGCNRYFGGYVEAEKALSVSGVGATKMACAAGLMEQETKYLTLLGMAKSFALNDRGGLVISTADGRTITYRPDGS